MKAVQHRFGCAVVVLSVLLALGGSLASATEYFVATTGADSTDHDGTSIDEAWVTINYALAHISGSDTLTIMAGTYNENIVNGVPSGTSWQNATTIRGNPGDIVVLKPSSDWQSVIAFGNVANMNRYVIIDNIIIDGDDMTYSGPSTAVGIVMFESLGDAHIRIQNCEIRKVAQGVVPKANYCELLNLRIHDFKNATPSADHGIYSYGDYLRVEDCGIFGSPGAGIKVGYQYVANFGSDHCTVRNNTCYDSRWGILISRGNDNLVCDNLCYDNDQEGILVEATDDTREPEVREVPAQYNVFHSNACYGNATNGIRIMPNANNNLFYNNLVYGNGGDGIRIGLVGGLSTAVATGNRLHNNTCYGNTGWGLALQTYSVDTIAKNNILYSNNSGAISDSGTGTTLGSNSASDPHFADAVNHDFHLAADSSCRDAGVTITDSETIDGVVYGVTSDFAGIARPQGSAYDIGAYEYVNRAPTVDAGEDTWRFEGVAVSLQADASDLDGDTLTHSWTQTAGKTEGVTLTGADTATLSFTAPVVSSLADAGMTFQVTVSDGHGGQATESINVRIYLAGDTNQDDSVDVVDVLSVSAAMGGVKDDPESDPPYDPYCDFNSDGGVDVVDVLTVSENMGRCFECE